MRHRHLDLAPDTPASDLGLAAIDDLIERGDLADWQPLLMEVARDPGGPVAERVLQLVRHHPMQGRSQLWRSWIEARRQPSEAFHAGSALRNLRLRRGLTQQRVAERMSMTQPEVSKLERRREVTLSTVRAYVAAVGGRLELRAMFDDDAVPIE
jgi:hypothetical protein